MGKVIKVVIQVKCLESLCLKKQFLEKSKLCYSPFLIAFRNMEVHIVTCPIKYQIRDGSFWQKSLSIFRTSAFLHRSVKTNRENGHISFNERSNNFSQFFCHDEKLKKFTRELFLIQSLSIPSALARGMRLVVLFVAYSRLQKRLHLHNQIDEIVRETHKIEMCKHQKTKMTNFESILFQFKPLFEVIQTIEHTQKAL